MRQNEEARRPGSTPGGGQRRLKAGSLKLLNTFSGEMGTASTDRRQPLVVSHSLTILRWVNKAFSTRRENSRIPLSASHERAFWEVRRGHEHMGTWGKGWRIQDWHH